MVTELGQVLHEEHFWTVVHVNGLENRVNDGRGRALFDPGRPADREELEAFLALLDDMARHHEFEETVLFPAIRKRGGAEVVGLFAEDHARMGSLVTRLRGLAQALLAGEPSDSACRAEGGGECGMARRLADFGWALAEFSDYVMAHIQREELGLVQKLDSLLDGETDRALAQAYMSSGPIRLSQAAE